MIITVAEVGDAKLNSIFLMADWTFTCGFGSAGVVARASTEIIIRMLALFKKAIRSWCPGLDVGTNHIRYI